MTKNNTASEHVEQVKFVNWFRYQYPNVLIFAIPNGGARHIVVAKNLKSEGVVAGVPDLFIPAWKLFIEMKREKGGKISNEQLKVMKYLNENGYRTLISKGCDAAIEHVKAFNATLESGKNG